jgi:hypothetical protein
MEIDMITNDSRSTTIGRQLVPCDQRSDHTAHLFGVHFPMQLEPYIFVVAAKLSPEYRGGYWQFYELGNGGFYMAPDVDTWFSVCCDNCYEGRLSGDALGITACLYAYSHLSFVAGEAIAEIYARQYHLLRNFMMEHVEVSAILAATD